MHGGLAGGIRAADNVYGLVFAGQRFGSSAAVVNAGALQAIHAGNVERAPLHAHGQEQSVAGNLDAIAQFEVAIGTVDAKADGFLRGKNLDVEPSRLRHCAAREIAAAESPDGKPR